MKEKNHKATKHISIVLSIFIFVILLIVGWQYRNYRFDNTSFLFKPQTNYSKNETLSYDSLRIKIVDPSNLYDDTGALAINYTIYNVSSNIVNLDNYSFKIVANTNFNSGDVHTGISSNVLPNSTASGWYVVDPYATNNYTGPLALTVSKPNHISKQIIIRQ